MRPTLLTLLILLLGAAFPVAAAELSVRVMAGPKPVESRVALRSLETWETVSATTAADGTARFTGIAPGIYTVTAPHYDTNQFARKVILVPVDGGEAVDLPISPEAPNPAFTLNPGSFAKLVIKNAERGDKAAVPGGITELRREQALWKANKAELKALFADRITELRSGLSRDEDAALGTELEAAKTRRGRIAAIKARVAAAAEGEPDHGVLRRLLLLHEAQDSHTTMLRNTGRALEDLEDQLVE